jgi:adenosylcobinamide-GDP ribazoletransferase
VAAALSTVFGVLLTGAFHEDGLADTADGLGGGLTRERALEIMKDSRIGSYGAVALVLSLMTKLCLLVLLIQIGTAFAVVGLFAAHVTSRLAPLGLIWRMPHVGDAAGSKSKPLADQITPAQLGVGLLWWCSAMALAAAVVPATALLGAVAGALFGAASVAWRLQRRLQGFTGDGLGACQQMAEIGFYLGLALTAGMLT